MKFYLMIPFQNLFNDDYYINDDHGVKGLSNGKKWLKTEREERGEERNRRKEKSERKEARIDTKKKRKGR